MDFKTVREFHWLTKAVIILTVFVLVLFLSIFIVAILGFSPSGLGFFLLSFTPVLMQVFLIVLVIIAVCIVATWIKTWMEKYLDAILAKLDVLMEIKSSDEKFDARLAVMSSRIEGIEKKIDDIADILKKVGD